MATFDEVVNGYEKYCSDHSIDGDAMVVYAEYVGDQDQDIDVVRREFEEAYQGTWDSMAEFAKDLAEDMGLDISGEWPKYCIDWEYAGNELRHDYFECSTPGLDGRIYIFRNL